ncbi:MAG TPA: LysR substrate-binding domain-containing protein [Polyangiales bacterium]|nr:LysR substrate-binding domain-containing protein [Polyangiales bacterium]
MHDAAPKLHDVPLGFLPAFEAAGRLGSFAAAAAELHITPSAVSQQIRSLENVLGVALFERNGRAAVLTSDGKTYLCEVRDALSALSTSTARLRRRTRSSVLRLHTMSVAAHEFLLPRLPAFRERFPALELRIETSNEQVDFRHTDCDAALRIGHGWPELKVKPLGTAVAAAVCAPSLASEIRRPADLHRYTLLDPNGAAQQAFAMLMSGAGLPPTAAKVWSFETCQEALLAAESGLGVAFGVFPLATHWVNSGRLVVPLANRLPLPGQVCLVYRALDEARFELAKIADWFAAQYAALAELPPGRIVRAGAA